MSCGDPMDEIVGKVIGTCSLCEGAVVVPVMWFGINNPEPTCSKCGAVRDACFGPVIPMKHRQYTVTSNKFELSTFQLNTTSAEMLIISEEEKKQDE